MSAAARFHLKRASFSSVFPSVAGPAVGGFAGYSLGQRLGHPELGALLGTLSLGTAGKLVSEKVEQAEQAPAIPPGAPYALDSTSEDIPPWALQGAQLLQPHMKQGSHFSDLIGGDLGGLAWPAYEGIRDKQPMGQTMKNVAGQGLGTLGGGLAGHAAGGLIDKVVGHPVSGPLGVPLSTLLAGLGATIGNYKGLELARR